MIRCLTIDDNIEVCNDIASRLHELHHVCDIANCVEEAEKRIKTTKYDYILLDMELPFGVNSLSHIDVGLRFMQRLRREYSQTALPIIVITGHIEQSCGWGINIYNAGANDVLLKPLVSYGNHTLESVIRKHIDKTEPLPEQPGAWLKRDFDGADVIFETHAKNGKIRQFRVRLKTKMVKLLDEIFVDIQKSPKIYYIDIQKACGWSPRDFEGAGGRKTLSVRGPVRQYMSTLKKELGIEHTWLEHAIEILQPKE